MRSWNRKKSNLWLSMILVISIFAGIIGNTLRETNVSGGTLLILILLMIPFGIELLRKKDPILYYGLDFLTLKKINIKYVLGVAFALFIIIGFLDHFLFGLWKLMLDTDKKMTVGSTSVSLARSNFFYLAVIVVFSGTLLEELWFRGLIFYKIKSIKYLQKINPHFAIIFQAVLFGLIHFIPIYYGTDFQLSIKYWFLFYPFVIGVIIGYINEKYNSLWPGWIIHYTNNISSIFLLTILFRL
jgi:membrane protease YdiL (CAAX protease family)